jgi:dihydropteroate synthase
MWPVRRAAILDIGGESTRPGARSGRCRDGTGAGPSGDRRGAGRPCRRRSCPSTPIAPTPPERPSKPVRTSSTTSGGCSASRISPMSRLTSGAGLCIMHTGREREKLADVVEDQLRLFRAPRSRLLTRPGCVREQIVLDPGFGFAKDPARELRADGALRGAARIWVFRSSSARAASASSVTRPGARRPDRAAGTAATTALLRAAGALR